MSLYYDREGKPMSREQYCAQDRKSYVRVAETIVELRGEKTAWVSTVWLGINHQYGDGPPLIFETMVFSEDDDVDGYMRRYSTEAEARTGHNAVVIELRYQTLYGPVTNEVTP